MGQEYRLTRDVSYGADTGRRYVGAGVHEVADGDVEEIKGSRLWEPVDNDDGGDGDDSTEDAEEQEQGDGEEADADDGDAEDPETDGGGGFDAAEFIDRNWRTVVADIEDADADGNLDAVEQAEKDRDSTRESVIDAIDKRL